MTAPLVSPSTTQKTNGPAAKKARLQRRQSSVYTSDSAKRKWRDMERLVSLSACLSVCLSKAPFIYLRLMR